MNKIISSSIRNTPLFPELESLMKFLAINPNSVRVSNPFEIFSHPQKGYGLKATLKIRENDQIFMVSTTKCITGLELIDCTPTKTFEIMKISEKIAEKYNKTNPSQYTYTVNLIKIALQLFVHKKDSSVSLHSYAKFLSKSKMTNPLYWTEKTIKQIYSNNLVNLIGGTRNYINLIKNDLENNNIHGINFEELVNLLSIIRSRNLNFIPSETKTYSKDYVCILCPIVDLINHSFNANCRIEGIYSHNDSESFVLVRALREIKENEELTINYGNYGNHDFLMKFGFLNQNNDFNELSINLDYDKYLFLTEQQFDLKKKIMRTSSENISLENITLYNNKINDDILKMLRLYFLTNKDIMERPEIGSFIWKNFKEKISNENEIKICEFMIEGLKNELKIYEENKRKRFNENESDIDINMKLICEDEVNIITRNLKFFESKLLNLIN